MVVDEGLLEYGVFVCVLEGMQMPEHMSINFNNKHPSICQPPYSQL